MSHMEKETKLQPDIINPHCDANMFLVYYSIVLYRLGMLPKQLD